MKERAVPLTADYEQVSTVVLKQVGPPAVIEPADVRMLGQVQSGAVQTPVATVLPFEHHTLEVHPDRLVLATSNVTDEYMAAHHKALLVLVDEYLGRRSVRAVGQNFVLRCRHDDLAGQEFMLSVLPGRLSAGLAGRRLEAAIELTYYVERDSEYRVQVKIEPSRKVDLEAVYFAFNFHREVEGGFKSAQDTEEGLYLPEWMEDEIGSVVDLTLEVSHVGGES